MYIEIDYESLYPNFPTNMQLSTTTLSTISTNISYDELCTLPNN